MFITVTKDKTVKFLKADSMTVCWESTPGAQTQMLLSRADETLAGGQRGSGMTQGLLAWFCVGDPSLPGTDPAAYSFLLDHSFRGLLLTSAVYDALEAAEHMYQPLRGVLNRDRAVVKFPSGATILVRDIDTPLREFQGRFTRIGIDGLCDMASESRYLKIMLQLGNVRRDRDGNLITPLRCQILSTARCDGEGLQWVRRRFVRHGGIPDAGLTRAFIPMFFSENPYLAETSYMSVMQSLDERTRRAWMEGDWDADETGRPESASPTESDK